MHTSGYAYSVMAETQGRMHCCKRSLGQYTHSDSETVLVSTDHVIECVWSKRSVYTRVFCSVPFRSLNTLCNITSIFPHGQ